MYKFNGKSNLLYEWRQLVPNVKMETFSLCDIRYVANSCWEILGLQRKYYVVVIIDFFFVFLR